MHEITRYRKGGIKTVNKEQESFRYQWKHVYKHAITSIEKNKREFLNTSGISPDWIRDKKVLDMGCGPGRLTFVLESLGAKVVAVDFVKSCLDCIKERSSKIETLLADFNTIHFQRSSFDLIVCIGVLHHTASPEENFRKLASLLKRGGVMYIMVYEKYNPLKLWLTGILRKRVGRMSYEKRMSVCRKIAKLNCNIVINRLAKLFIDVPHTAMSTFDRYSNQYHSHHTEKEVVRWFNDCGFDGVKVTSPKLNRNPVAGFLKGKHSGVLFVTGRLH